MGLGSQWITLLSLASLLHSPSAAGTPIASRMREPRDKAQLSLSLCDAAVRAVSYKQDARYSYLSNGYVCMALDRSAPSIVHLSGDLSGSGRYGGNTLVGDGIVLETLLPDGKVESCASNDGVDLAKVIVSGDDRHTRLTVSGVAGASKLLEEVWTLDLARDARYLEFHATGRLLTAQQAVLVRRSYSLRPSSIYGLYEHGVVQMKDQYDNYNSYVSDDHLPLLYSLGGAGQDTLHAAGNISLTIERVWREGYPGNLTALESAAKERPWRTRFQEILAGGDCYPGPLHRWHHSVDEHAMTEVCLAPATAWASLTRLWPNNGDFPSVGITTDRNLPERDLRAMLTGLYATSVGCLNTHYGAIEQEKHLKEIATGVNFPVTHYNNMFNFFDPDSYLTTAALLYTGNPYIQQQTRMVLERSGECMDGRGQVPHHFVWGEPQFTAISDETMPSPNIFWVMSCLNYAKTTGDLKWLTDYMPKLRSATEYILSMLDLKSGLAASRSSLFIDVIVRANFTTDLNAMLVGFFREFGAAEDAVGNKTGATTMRILSKRTALAMTKLLWHEKDDDHFVTQRNLDGSLRDMVDYDANLIALAHGVVQPDKAAKVLRRIDSGQCTHGRATWVSERIYNGTGDVVGGGQTSDAVSSMGRIGWYDALARKRVGDLLTFDRVILEPLIDDVLKYTWLHERYNCDGSPQTDRAAYYFEYPSVVAMMLRSIRYGINISYRTILIQPFGPRQFSYHIGNVHVDYSPDSVTTKLDLTGQRTFVIQGMSAGPTRYLLSVNGGVQGTVVAESNGVLRFELELTPGMVVSVQKEIASAALKGRRRKALSLLTLQSRGPRTGA